MCEPRPHHSNDCVDWGDFAGRDSRMAVRFSQGCRLFVAGENPQSLCDFSKHPNLTPFIPDLGFG